MTTKREIQARVGQRKYYTKLLDFSFICRRRGLSSDVVGVGIGHLTVVFNSAKMCRYNFVLCVVNILFSKLVDFVAKHS